MGFIFIWVLGPIDNIQVNTFFSIILVGPQVLIH
jgi:hypothetical protein